MTSRRMSKFSFNSISLGGTFDAMHAGHLDYLDIGLRLGSHLEVYITPDIIAAETKAYEVKAFDQRAFQVLDYLHSHRSLGQSISIYGYDEAPFLHLRSASECTGALVEPAYLNAFELINDQRTANGMQPVYTVRKERTQLHGQDLSSTTVRHVLGQ